MELGVDCLGRPQGSNVTAVSYTHLDVYKRQERSFKEIVVANRHAPKNVGEIHLLVGRQVFEGTQMALTKYERFEWPERPEWHEGCE